jgi:hypothetical protein
MTAGKILSLRADTSDALALADKAAATQIVC